MDIELLIASLAFIIPMCFSPGPNNVLCAAHGSQHGFRGTLILISGMAFGWSTLGLFVAVATDLIEENQDCIRFTNICRRRLYRLSFLQNSHFEYY